MAIVDERRANVPDRPRGRWAELAGLPEVRWALVAMTLFACGCAAQLLGSPLWVWWALYLACYAAGGWEPALAGLRVLRERSLDVDLLMIVAAIAAASIGQVFDGALLIVIFATSGALESFMTRRTADSVNALLDLAPQQATRLTDAGGEVVATSTLVVGDVVLVRPGERIGADGRVVDGVSEVDQASVTGESVPRTKRRDDEVFAGTLNGTGSLRIRVERAAAESVVARIADLVERASRTKAHGQLFIEKIESRYSVAVVAVTLLLVGIPLLAGAPFAPTLLRAMTFMIVASPCAVVLATMPPLLSAIANAGRHGVLVKSAVVMERLGRTTIVAFDKTGTLTEGAPRVVEVVEVDPHRTYPSDAALGLAAAVEFDSEHPIGRAIVTAAHERNLTIPGAARFHSTPGEGVRGFVGGVAVKVSSPIVLGSDADDDHQAARIHAAELEAQGHTAVVVLIDQASTLVIGLADRARLDSRDTVDALTALTGHRPVLLTGDNPQAAALLAAETGIADVRADLLPEDKVAAITTLQAQGHQVLVVGDGVNDAPAMAAADLGAAMGHAGSDLAVETSDLVIVRDELSALPALIELSRRARRVVCANLAVAVAVISVLVIWDLVAILPLPLGVAGHEGSTVIVGLNGLRLLRTHVWREGDR